MFKIGYVYAVKHFVHWNVFYKDLHLIKNLIILCPTAHAFYRSQSKI
jgi:hypothetical protein